MCVVNFKQMTQIFIERKIYLFSLNKYLKNIQGPTNDSSTDPNHFQSEASQEATGVVTLHGSHHYTGRYWMAMLMRKLGK